MDPENALLTQLRICTEAQLAALPAEGESAAGEAGALSTVPSPASPEQKEEQAAAARVAERQRVLLAEHRQMLAEADKPAAGTASPEEARRSVAQRQLRGRPGLQRFDSGSFYSGGRGGGGGGGGRGGGAGEGKGAGRGLPTQRGGGRGLLGQGSGSLNGRPPGSGSPAAAKVGAARLASPSRDYKPKSPPKNAVAPLPLSATQPQPLSAESLRSSPPPDAPSGAPPHAQATHSSGTPPTAQEVRVNLAFAKEGLIGRQLGAGLTI